MQERREMKDLENSKGHQETRIPEETSYDILHLPILLQAERRFDLERRRFSYTTHVPERRSGRDRREPNKRQRNQRRKPDA